jgi:hypothetical protein
MLPINHTGNPLGKAWKGHPTTAFNPTLRAIYLKNFSTNP